MQTYRVDSLRVTSILGAVVSHVRFGESAVNDPALRGAVCADHAVQQVSGGIPYPYPLGARDQWWGEGRATPTFRTFAEGVVILGAAWWIAPSGMIHHRVCGGRLFAKTVYALRRLLRPWGLSEREAFLANGVCFVYPELYFAPPPFWDKSTRARLERGVVAEPLDAEAWAVLLDWSLDHLGPAEQGKARAGYERAALLASGKACKESLINRGLGQ